MQVVNHSRNVVIKNTNIERDKIMGFKTELFERFKNGYLDGNPNASSQEIDQEFDKCLKKIAWDAEEIAKDNKRSGKWWLSIEGRVEAKKIWDNKDDDVPRIYLDEIERLEGIIEDYNRNRHLFKNIENWNQDND